MNLFYALPEDIKVSGITIRGQEAVHITKVLRYPVGNRVEVTDGRGNLYHCEISSIGKSDVDLSILTRESEERSPPFITLCIGHIKKRDRLEFALEKATELGVDRLIIFRGDHSQKGGIRKDRLIATVQSAMKQSLRLFFPELYLEDSLTDALKHQNEGEFLLMADESTDSVHRKVDEKEALFLIVGPEGGFSLRERDLLNKKGAVQISLGSKRLRTETAAIVMTDRFKSAYIK